MKKILVITFKIVLPILFLYNIGFFSLDFAGFYKDLGKSEPYNPSNQIKFVNFVKEKVRCAKLMGKKYCPNKYFDDLYRIGSCRKSLKGIIRYPLGENELVCLLDSNCDKGFFTSDDVSRAAQVYKERIDPQREPREKLKKEMAKEGFWPKTFKALFHFYLNNLPLAFFLFAFWYYEKNGNFKTNNPFSFIISVIFYPIILLKMIYFYEEEHSRYYLAEAELRRTKDKMFSYLSKNEIEDIKRFAKNRGITLSDWKQYLSDQGLKPQGFLISSLIVTLLFTAMPKFSCSQEKIKTREYTSTTLLIKAGYPPGNHCSFSINHRTNQLISFDCFFNYFFYEFDTINLQSIFISIWVKLFYPQEVIRKIEHVPCLGF